MTSKRSLKIAALDIGTNSVHMIIANAVVAYASDFNLISTALMPHGLSFMMPHLQVASLDHALWFHGEVKTNDWLLYALDSPWSGNARGLSRGQVFTRDGRLVASVAQEGLMRVRGGKGQP